MWSDKPLIAVTLFTFIIPQFHKKSSVLFRTLFSYSKLKSEVNKMSEKKFELRKLCAKDIFVKVKIISKISIS